MTAHTRALLHGAVWLVLALYAALVVHDFYWYADRLVYLALDDALANQAYVLATEGRYGFLASPTLYGVPRHIGEVSYGPWYFYLAGLLVWLFGYSLTLVRSIHLWILVGIIIAGAVWFRGPARAVAAGTLGLTALYCFDVAMWPMARPDSIVSAFAVALIVCAGLGTARGDVRYWFGAGLAASCGAFAHLIAWPLVPASVLLFVAWAVPRWRAATEGQARWHVKKAFAALAAGGLLGAGMFYASFGFRLADQLHMFGIYGQIVESSEGYWTVVGRHLATAFGYLRPWQQGAIGLLLATAWITVALGVRAGGAARRAVRVVLLPPVLVWTAYVLGNGTYTNYHKNYAILHQVSAAWTAAALIWVWLDLAEARWPRAGRVLAALAAGLVLVQGARLVGGHAAQGPERATRAQQWVSIAAYTERVLDPIPTGATVWGPVVFGIETPRRLQLIQMFEAVAFAPRIAPEVRRELLPDYLIWGHAEARDSVVVVMRGGESLYNQVADLLDPARYRLVSMVAGAPYGVTRVYARVDPARPEREDLPAVSAHDPERGIWLERTGPALDVAFVPVPPAVFRMGYGGDAAPRAADRTVAADLPAGRYLLRVTIRPGDGHERRRLLAATSGAQFEQAIGETGPLGDFGPYLSNQGVVFLLSLHDGGPLYVSQIDTAPGAAIERVEAYPVFGALDPDEAPPSAADVRALPPVWGPVATQRISKMAEDRLLVEGDADLNAYQVASPPVEVQPGDRVRVELDLRVEQGVVCTGVLNGPQARWLVPADRLRRELAFTADRTGRFILVVANCGPAGSPPSRFTLGPGRYRVDSAALYTDRLMRAVFGENLDGPR